MHVEVRNFQSIAEETVEISGFSVVVGRSNIGKSALVRAVKAALTGAPVENYVRHAADCQRILKGSKSCKCYCSVRIRGPEFDLLWEKGDSVNRYVFNGAEHTVVGKGTPEFLGPEFAPIYIGGDSTPTLLQVADQFRPLFILDRSGTAVADVLSDVAKLDQINDAARAAEKDKREAAAIRKVRDRDVKELGASLHQYAGLDAVVTKVRDVEDLEVAVSELEVRVDALERFAGTFTQLTALIEALQPVANIEVPPVAPLSEKSRALFSLGRWLELLRIKGASAGQLEQLAAVEVPTISDAIQLADLARRLTKWSGQLVAMKRLFAGFKAVESVKVPEISTVTERYGKFRSLVGMVDRYVTLEDTTLKLQRAVGVAEVEEAAVLAEFKALEVCPMCSQPVDVVSHSHLGGT